MPIGVGENFFLNWTLENFSIAVTLREVTREILQTFKTRPLTKFMVFSPHLIAGNAIMPSSNETQHRTPLQVFDEDLI